MQNIRTSSGSFSFTASRRFVVAAVSMAAALACGGAFAQGQAGTVTTEAYAAGRILVMPRAGLPDSALARILNENGGGKARRIGKSELRIVDLPRGREKAMVERLARHPHVKFAELDRVALPDGTTNDPYLGSQWHLSRIGAINAWDQSAGSGVTIAVLDTGVDAGHPDLSPRVVPGWNFFNNTSDTSDAYNHGTGVAGAAAAAMNNSLGVAGVSGQTKIMPIRISDGSGSGSWSAMAQGLTYAADRGVRVANISFSSAAGSSSVISAAQYMKSKGGLVFISAGNTGTASIYSPTTALIVTGATNSDDTRRSTSTFGPIVSLAAPGTGVYTTTKGGGYVAESGTSFASPVAAGVAALVFAANPGLSSAQAESILFTSAVDLGAPGRDNDFGYGRVDAAKAVQLALSTVGAPPPDSQAPTAAIVSPSSSSTVAGIVAVEVSTSDNFGVTRAALLVNGKVVASDTVAPFAFSWDSTAVSNGSASLVLQAYDAAGNVGTSATTILNVANNIAPDTVAPVPTISNPLNGSTVSGNVSIGVKTTDNSGPAAISQTLFVGGRQVASGIGGSLNFNWNTRKLSAGSSHTIQAVARDAAGNTATSSVTVKVGR
jgi:thermitase